MPVDANREMVALALLATAVAATIWSVPDAVLLAWWLGATVATRGAGRDR